MSDHTFGDRLFFIRHHVKRLPRTELSEEVGRVALKRPDFPAVLHSLTAAEIRAWEHGTSVATSEVRSGIAHVLGLAKNLLDPDLGGWKVPPATILRAARARGWGQLEIGHAWRLIQRMPFSGQPTGLDVEPLLDQVQAKLPRTPSRSLFLDEFWCTHCGHWESESHNTCPKCGNRE